MADAPRPDDRTTARADGSEYEDVLVALIDALDQGPPAVEQLLAAHPQHATKLRAHLTRLRGLGLLEAPAPAPDAPPRAFPERIGEYRLLRRLGSGGMGVVYLAEQASLGRRVALKLVRSEHLFFPGARERFRREVDAIARLQHPGIVPVHAAGEDGGVPWLAMDHVAGASLDEVVQQLAGRPPESLRGDDLAAAVRAATAAHARAGEPAAATSTTTSTLEPAAAGRAASPSDAANAAELFRGSWISVCLRIARAVAQALQHAHDRGVLHRDVKPSNVMVTPEGRVQLLDFGLASHAEGSRLTRTGSQLGTPAYMSPEQMRGDHDALDGRSDVYSLAVTLRELLTLRSPFASGSTAAVRDAVLAGTAPPLREQNPAVSRDLEVVCRKAMDVEPAQRYAAAAAFADDLGNLLELRPIQAQPPSAFRIVRRWSQRHPARAVAILAGVLLFLVAPTVFLLQARTANAEIRLALDGAREQERLAKLARDEARRQRDLAKEAVDTLLTRVAGEQLFEIPRLQRVRRDLLADARSFYERFLADGTEDPDLVEQTARAALQMVFVEGELGRLEAAFGEAERAVALARQAAARRGDTIDMQLLLTDALMTRGRVQHMMLRLDEAMASYDEARALGRAVLAREPRQPRAITHLLGVERGVSLTRIAQERTDDAEAAFRALATLWREHGDATVGDDYREIALDHVLCSLADEAQFHVRRGQPGAASLALRALGEIAAGTELEELPVSARIAVARAEVTRAALAAAGGDAAAEERALQECLRIADQVLADNPDHANALRTRAHACNSLGLWTLRRAGHQGESMPWFEASLQALRKLVASDPSVTDNRANLAATLVNIGSELKDAGQFAAAKALFVEAEALARDCWQALPSRRDWRTTYYNAVWFRAQVCGDLGEAGEQADAAQLFATIVPDDGKSWRIAAGLLLDARAAAAGDRSRPADDRERDAEQFLRLALSHAQRAAENGCTDVEVVRDSEQFAPLRAVPGFADVLRKIEANAAAAGARR